MYKYNMTKEAVREDRFFFITDYNIIKYTGLMNDNHRQEHWSQEADDDLRTLHGEHWSLSEIARIMGRTVEAIRHRKKKLHLGRCLKMDAHNIVRRRKKQQKREARLCMA